MFGHLGLSTKGLKHSMKMSKYAVQVGRSRSLISSRPERVGDAEAETELLPLTSTFFRVPFSFAQKGQVVFDALLVNARATGPLQYRMLSTGDKPDVSRACPTRTRTFSTFSYTSLRGRDQVYCSFCNRRFRPPAAGALSWLLRRNERFSSSAWRHSVKLSKTSD